MFKFQAKSDTYIHCALTALIQYTHSFIGFSLLLNHMGNFFPCGNVFSDCVQNYTKAMQQVLEICKMAKYFPDKFCKQFLCAVSL